MADDRELLELAAKAAELVVSHWAEGGLYVGKSADCMDVDWWNPLTDDGDALRLAVKLNLHLGLEDMVANAWQGGMRHWQTVAHNGDPVAATRRAIVLAAAAIGRRMP